MTMPLIPDIQPSEKNHFPIVGQLVVLTLILGVTFGSLWWFSPARDGIAQDPNVRPTVNLRDIEPLDTPDAIENVSLNATAAYVWDVRGQRALYKKNEKEILPLASITKLMTALVTHELISEMTDVALPLTAIRQEGASGLIEGETLSIEELNELALVSSSNDAAFALANAAGALLGDRDPAQQFIAAMNIRADELNLDSLSFANTTGLDLNTSTPGAVGSAKDVSFLLEHIIEEYPQLISITQEPVTRVYNSSGIYHDAENTNAIVNRIPNLLASKTGYTDLAGGNLTVAFDLGLDRPIIITVLGSTRDARFTDVLTLIEAVQASVVTP
jgi:D-alanyl-D-alanine endopeptidase (penicillin-binding protein 7)